MIDHCIDNAFVFGNELNHFISQLSSHNQCFLFKRFGRGKGRQWWGSGGGTVVVGVVVGVAGGVAVVVVDAAVVAAAVAAGTGTGVLSRGTRVFVFFPMNVLAF